MMSAYKEKLMELLSIEYNCAADAFKQKNAVLTESCLAEGRRAYSHQKPFFQMVTMGNNAVMTSDPCLHSFLSTFSKDKVGFWLFEVPNLLELERELNKYDYTLSQTHHMFLPSVKTQPKLDCAVQWFYDRDIKSFYGDGRFPNAICEKYLPERPDRIVVVAKNGDEIMGMAGCSEDAPNWMQIGIDVLPEYRSLGIGTDLVIRLKNRIEEMGCIPFYGTGVSNYYSWNIAINSGFRPAWVEIGAKPIKR